MKPLNRDVRYSPWRPIVLGAIVAGPWALVVLALSLAARFVYVAVFADDAVPLRYEARPRT